MTAGFTVGWYRKAKHNHNRSDCRKLVAQLLNLYTVDCRQFRHSKPVHKAFQFRAYVVHMGHCEASAVNTSKAWWSSTIVGCIREHVFLLWEFVFVRQSIASYCWCVKCKSFWRQINELSSMYIYHMFRHDIKYPLGFFLIDWRLVHIRVFYFPLMSCVLWLDLADRYSELYGENRHFN